MTLGEEIRALREKKGLTQLELARQIKVKRQYLSRIENNRQLPSMKALVRLGRSLGIPQGKLQRIYEDAELEMKIRGIGFKEAKMIQFVRALLKMPDKRKQTILRFYQSLA